jgi:hypothetical protein
MHSSLDQWRSTMADMVLFHREQKLTWLWLPTPSQWIEGLCAQDNPEQGALRRVLMSPSTPQPRGLTWHAWDTRNTIELTDDKTLTEWYAHWACAQSSSA